MGARPWSMWEDVTIDSLMLTRAWNGGGGRVCMPRHGREPMADRASCQFHVHGDPGIHIPRHGVTEFVFTSRPQSLAFHDQILVIQNTGRPGRLDEQGRLTRRKPLIGAETYRSTGRIAHKFSGGNFGKADLAGILRNRLRASGDYWVRVSAKQRTDTWRFCSGTLSATGELGFERHIPRA